MPKVTTTGKKAQEIESDVNIETKEGTSTNQDANPLAAKKSNDELAPASGEEAQKTDVDAAKGEYPFNFKRTRDHLEGSAVPENDEVIFKKPMIRAKHGQLIPKRVSKTEFVETSRRKIAAMTRGELEDFAMQKIVDEKTAKSKHDVMSKQWANNEKKLATYHRKITVVAKKVHQLGLMGIKKSTKSTPKVKPSQTSSKTCPLKGPEPDQQSPKCSTKVRSALPVHMSSTGGKTSCPPRKMKFTKLTEAKTIAAAKAKPANTTKEKSALLGEAAKNTAKEETAQEEAGKRLSL